jgi:Uma2 family endonuclease
MPQTLIHPPKTMLEVWESLPEGTLCQLINNKLIMSAAPRDIHQAILFGIAFELQTFLKRRKLGELRISPYNVHFTNQNILQLDLLFIKNENLHKVEKNRLYGAPGVIIEVLSPSTS